MTESGAWLPSTKRGTSESGGHGYRISSVFGIKLREAELSRRKIYTIYGVKVYVAFVVKSALLGGNC